MGLCVDYSIDVGYRQIANRLADLDELHRNTIKNDLRLVIHSLIRVWIPPGSEHHHFERLLERFRSTLINIVQEIELQEED